MQHKKPYLFGIFLSNLNANSFKEVQNIIFPHNKYLKPLKYYELKLLS